MRSTTNNPREQLVHHVQQLERLELLKAEAANDLREAFDAAAGQGYDRSTLKAVLKLRKMTPGQRSERRALEAIYMAALGMLEGESLPEEARRRLDGIDEPPARAAAPSQAPAPAPDAEPVPDAQAAPAAAATPPPPAQPPLIVKDPAEARTEGADAAAAGQRIYDNPYRAGDPCRAAWDEGWCSQKQSHGMETPAAYQRRSDKPSKDAGDKDQGAGAAAVGA